MSPSNASVRSGFAEYQFEAVLMRGIEAAGYSAPRTIQSQTLPAALEGRDILGLAQTGTGKTAAFALPLIDLVLEMQARQTVGLVVAPTRELASQIDAEIRALAKFTKITTLTVFGGVPMGRQIRGLKNRPDIIVACPGRLLDLYEQGHVNLSKVETLVLDEADHMFDMGFLPAIRKILTLVPKERQNLMFSATMPPEIRRLANEVLDRPLVVELANSQPAATIDHVLHPVHPEHKVQMLLHLLNGEKDKSTIVFTRTKHRARRLAKQLGQSGHRAVALEGNMSQGQRDRAMQGFRRGDHRILVATDIAARGIDVSSVGVVINFDPPNTPENYTHRIGRTGRSENEGRARTFVCREDEDWIRATERHLKMRLVRESVEGFVARPVQDRGPRPQMPHAPVAHANAGSRSGSGSRSRSGAGSGAGGNRRSNSNSSRRSNDRPSSNGGGGRKRQSRSRSRRSA